MTEDRKSFEQLGKENATCLEYALNGYIRIYEEGEEECKCLSCENLKILEGSFWGKRQ